MAAAFTLVAGLVTYYALKGGSYDIVVRQGEAIAVWWAVGLGAAFGLFPRVRFRRAGLVALAAGAGFALWTFISLGWTLSDERTLAEVARVLHYLGIAVLVLGLVDRRTAPAAIAGAAAGASLVCALAVGSQLFPSSFPDDTIARVYDTNRLNYPLNYWNAVGALAAMSIGLGLAWSAHARSPILRAATLATVPLAALTAYLTYSRGAAIVVAVAVIVVLVLARNRWVTALHALVAGLGSGIVILRARAHQGIVDGVGGDGAVELVLILVCMGLICAGAVALSSAAEGDTRWRLPRRTGRLAAAAMVFVVLAAAAVPASGRVDDAWDDFRTGEGPATTADPAERLTSFSGERYGPWKTALETFGDEPLKGEGAGTFEFIWNLDGGEMLFEDAHSLYLEQLAELGAPGLLLVLGFLGALGTGAVLTRRGLEDGTAIGAHVGACACFSVFLVSAGIDWMWESTAVATLALICICSATALRAEPAGRPRWPLRAGLAGAAVLACLVQLPGLVSTSQIRESRQAFNDGDLPAALESATQAVEAEPWAASPYVQRALLHEQLEEFGAARVDLQRAEDREPENRRHPLALARVLARAGHPEQALASYKAAKRLRPRSRFFGPPQ